MDGYRGCDHIFQDDMERIFPLYRLNMLEEGSLEGWLLMLYDFLFIIPRRVSKVISEYGESEGRLVASMHSLSRSDHAGAFNDGNSLCWFREERERMESRGSTARLRCSCFFIWLIL